MHIYQLCSVNDQNLKILNRSHKIGENQSSEIWLKSLWRAEKFTTLQFAQYFLKLSRISSRMGQFGPFGPCTRMSTLGGQSICINFDGLLFM